MFYFQSWLGETWKMVKLDLERVGIPNLTDEGFADFHTSGRHTHITELLRNCATLPETKELASWTRHFYQPLCVNTRLLPHEPGANALRLMSQRIPVF